MLSSPTPSPGDYNAFNQGPTWAGGTTRRLGRRANSFRGDCCRIHTAKPDNLSHREALHSLLSSGDSSLSHLAPVLLGESLASLAARIQDSRPAALTHLKLLGVQSLRDRQSLINRVSRAAREGLLRCSVRAPVASDSLSAVEAALAALSALTDPKLEAADGDSSDASTHSRTTAVRMALLKGLGLSDASARKLLDRQPLDAAALAALLPAGELAIACQELGMPAAQARAVCDRCLDGSPATGGATPDRAAAVEERLEIERRRRVEAESEAARAAGFLCGVRRAAGSPFSSPGVALCFAAASRAETADGAEAALHHLQPRLGMQSVGFLLPRPQRHGTEGQADYIAACVAAVCAAERGVPIAALVSVGAAAAEPVRLYARRCTAASAGDSGEGTGTVGGGGGRPLAPAPPPQLRRGIRLALLGGLTPTPLPGTVAPAADACAVPPGWRGLAVRSLGRVAARAAMAGERFLTAAARAFNDWCEGARRLRGPDVGGGAAEGDNGLGSGICALAAALRRNATLSSVDLGDNGVAAEGVEALAAALQAGNKSLCTLGTGFIREAGRALAGLPPPPHVVLAAGLRANAEASRGGEGGAEGSPTVAGAEAQREGAPRAAPRTTLGERYRMRMLGGGPVGEGGGSSGGRHEGV
ncbi:hypothetical protein EMIHUDRAFT_250081 [Emiliania huxleyi CCMP1516]|uniref:Uncharacterized protein n=2 Tax=Emiliania huxleyi TaxID=2903 RepID=A0A0D3I425_EMIH1|nr:hypothetical protein EMIHUDRAFT_250081 [Emiliania huxleyi CCMP1516]EOD06010.1 hypothetical protein EMIHUDRAFT_250081 [Emiliania huxleyi CCMP1516]|eukprot:XP_005758439.1 hypothetical protein EMIHUDRAFT_250081 [Emiliania huxleyi CCMP1516]